MFQLAQTDLPWRATRSLHPGEVVEISLSELVDLESGSWVPQVAVVRRD